MIKVLKANEKFLDKTYGEWGAEWRNWLCSEDPDNISESSPIVFLRDNIDYKGEGENRHQTGEHFEQQLTISKSSVSVFFPVLEAQFYMGHPYYYEAPFPVEKKEIHRMIETDEEMVYLLKKDLDDVTHLEATINGEKITPVRARSQIFTSKVSEKNVLRNKMQQGKVPPGEYRTIIDGSWVLAILSTGNHKIHFEGARKDLFYSATYNILLDKE